MKRQKRYYIRIISLGAIWLLNVILFQNCSPMETQKALTSALPTTTGITPPSPLPQPAPLLPAILEVIVATNGLATNPGTLAAPTTLEGARSILQKASRTKPGILRVLLRGGIYSRSSTFSLTAADTGSQNNPIEYVAYANETPRIIGGASIDPASLHLVTSADPNWARLDTSVRDKIYVADLAAYKTNLGSLASRADSASTTNQAMEVFTDAQPLTLARYPKATDSTKVDIAPHTTLRVSGTLTPDVTGDYTYRGLDTWGRPYYQLSKLSNVWTIAAAANGPQWKISNRTDLGGTGTQVAWSSWDNFAGPAGTIEPSTGATGKAFIAPADGSSAVPGFMLIRATNGSNQIQAPDSHMSRWQTSEAMYYGLGMYSWSGSHSPITSLDGATGTIQLSTNPTYGLRSGQPFFMYNLLEELSIPGEYFIDRVNARLYMRPINDSVPSEILVSLLQTPIVQMQSTQYITWRGIVLEAARDRLVLAKDCSNVTFQNMTFRNTGGEGILLNGYSNLIEASDFRQTGKSAVWLSGGNRFTITESNTLVENSEFQYFGRLFWTYSPAVYIHSMTDWSFNSDSIGFTIQHNEMHHAPHTAVWYAGSNITIRYNHIHDVTQWTNDAGVIYTAGREWGARNNLVQYNLLRNNTSPLGNYVTGIYVDGAGAGSTVEANILYHSSSMFAIQHNGGRDVHTRYNIISGGWYGVDISNVAFGFVDNVPGSGFNLLEKLVHFNYQSAPWSTAYPEVAAIPNDWNVLKASHWLEPEGSTLVGNLYQGLTSSVYRENNYNNTLGPIINSFAQVNSNLNNVDPQFVDPANLDFHLRSSSPMYSVPGFPGIDAAKIGIQK